jgi:hypothetical protein
VSGDDFDEFLAEETEISFQGYQASQPPRFSIVFKI